MGQFEGGKDRGRNRGKNDSFGSKRKSTGSDSFKRKNNDGAKPYGKKFETDKPLRSGYKRSNTDNDETNKDSGFGGERKKYSTEYKPRSGGFKSNRFGNDNNNDRHSDNNSSRPYRPRVNRDSNNETTGDSGFGGERKKYSTEYKPRSGGFKSNRFGNDNNNDRHSDNNSSRPYRPRVNRDSDNETTGDTEFGGVRKTNGFSNRQNNTDKFEDKRYGNKNEQSNSSYRSGEKRYQKYDKQRTTFSKTNLKKGEFTDTPKSGAPMRLNKYIANSGICSRRDADTYIETGMVTVNGKIITELGAKVNFDDDVRFDGKRINPEKKVYILLNKPKGYVTTVDDPHADHTVMELISGAGQERVYPVGRLDKSTTGLLLFTNDGELTDWLTHPKNNKKKIYQVTLDKPAKMEDLEKLYSGIELEDGITKADEVSYCNADDKCEVGIEIHSGKNRIVRRLFESLGYNVRKLDRVYFAGLTKKNLPRGKWRFLDDKEIIMLKRGSFA